MSHARFVCVRRLLLLSAVLLSAPRSFLVPTGRSTFSQNHVLTVCLPVPPAKTTQQVASGSQSHVVAGAIAGKVREEQPVCVKALGAETVAKSVYAIAHARQYLSKEGLVRRQLPTPP